MMLGRLRQELFLDADHLLIVSIHEIDHHAGDSPFLELGESLVYLRVQRFPAGP